MSVSQKPPGERNILCTASRKAAFHGYSLRAKGLPTDPTIDLMYRHLSASVATPSTARRGLNHSNSPYRGALLLTAFAFFIDSAHLVSGYKIVERAGAL
jgi:hypothetical protein